MADTPASSEPLRIAPAPRRESPLHARGATPLTLLGATIVERPFRPMFNLRADPADAAMCDALLAATGLAWPAPNRFEARDGCIAAWLGPDECLLIDADDSPDRDASDARAGRASPIDAFSERVGTTATGDAGRVATMPAARAGCIPAVTPVGAGYTTLSLSGTGVREVLARGCALDLLPRAFGPGDCLQTTFARAIVVLLHRGANGGDAPVVELIVRRSFADHVWRWLAAHA